MFEPITLPKAISGLTLSADLILTINSGADVPKEITVIPITNEEMLNFLAIPIEPLTKNSPPTIKVAKPSNKNNIVIPFQVLKAFLSVSTLQFHLGVYSSIKHRGIGRTI